jgi:hypothetical protein
MKYIILFIYGSFNDAASISGYTPSNIKIVNNELGGIWKELVAEYYPGIWLQILMIVSIHADIRTRNLPNTNEEYKISQFSFGNHRKCVMKSKTRYQARCKG